METLEDGGFSNLATVLKALIGDAVPPVGTIIDFAGASIPDGYLECDGSAVSRTTYAALFDVLGTTWGAGNGSTTFNLPNLGGRVAIGKGSRNVGATGGSETHTLTTDEMPNHAHDNTIKAKTPKFTHSITQPVFKYTAPASHSHGLGSGYACVQSASGDGILLRDKSGVSWTTTYRNRWSSLGSGSHSVSQTYGTELGGKTDSASCSGTANGTTASRTTNVGVGDHAATDCTMSGSISATGGGASHNIMQPYAVVRKLIRAL